MDFRKILVAVDNSTSAEKAAKVGYEMAAKFNAEIALLNIIEPTAAPVNPEFALTPVFMEMFEYSEENSQLLLRAIAKRIGSDIKTTYLSSMDTATHGIINQAEEWGAELIVVGTHGRTGFSHFIMGSVAEHVARKSACPVLIVPNKED